MNYSHSDHKIRFRFFFWAFKILIWSFLSGVPFLQTLALLSLPWIYLSHLSLLISISNLSIICQLFHSLLLLLFHSLYSFLQNKTNTNKSLFCCLYNVNIQCLVQCEASSLCMSDGVCILYRLFLYITLIYAIMIIHKCLCLYLIPNYCTNRT